MTDSTGRAGTGQRAAFAITVHLPVVARAAPMARDTVRAALARCDLPEDLLADALLVTSELVTNAFRHGGDDIFLALEVLEETLEIAVADGTPTVPTQRPAADDDESGRGLAIVSALTSAWGVDEGPDGGKRVWVRFELPRTR